VVVARGDVWWADFREPVGSEPGFRRPVVIVQNDGFNRSGIRTVIVVTVTSNLDLLRPAGNVLITADESGLSVDSVANVSQVATIDRRFLQKRIGRVSDSTLEAIDDGLRLLLDL